MDQNTARRKRDYFCVNTVLGYGPTCETREEAEQWLALECTEDMQASIVVVRMTPREYAALGEFQGW